MVGTPIDSMASAIYRALASDLPDIEYMHRKPGTNKDGKGWETEKRSRRPHEDDIEVYCFPQTWGSTALGFGGIGGQAMTTAYTTVVLCCDVAAVYFGGRLAYVIKNPTRTLWEDLAAHSMAERGKTAAYRQPDVSKRGGADA